MLGLWAGSTTLVPGMDLFQKAITYSLKTMANVG